MWIAPRTYRLTHLNGVDIDATETTLAVALGCSSCAERLYMATKDLA